MKRSTLAGLSILSGIFLYASWPVSPFTFCIFFAFIPLLYVADAVKKRNRFFLFCFISLLTWNAATTWWIWNSTDIGSIAAIAANSLLMCLPWWGYHIFKYKYGKRTGYVSLIAFWMLFEYVHLNWQLSWPWLTLGNVFATHPSWVQWYSYTGVGGGTLWVLVVNVFVKLTVDRWQMTVRMPLPRKRVLYSVLLLFLIGLPLAFSSLSVQKVKTTAFTGNVVIIQPNVDPYQKFETLSPSQQVQQLLSLSEQAIDSSTQLLLWPETALDAGVMQNEVETAPVYQPVFTFMGHHPGMVLLTGIETSKNYGTEKASSTARKAENGTYYDAFNAAVVISAGQPLQFYHKSKLVPGVESLPNFLNFMAPVFEKFGGTTGGYTRDSSSVAFHVPGNSYVTAPIICYESIYGEYVGSYVQKGANLLTIITNDGWWGNTPGHQQHLHYASLRAIETGRWVARSANTGISAVIDEKGNILATQPWGKAAAIKYPIPALTGQTFYVRFGDWLYKIATVIAVLLFAWNLFLFSKKSLKGLRSSKSLKG